MQEVALLLITGWLIGVLLIIMTTWKSFRISVGDGMDYSLISKSCFPSTHRCLGNLEKRYSVTSIPSSLEQQENLGYTVKKLEQLTESLGPILAS